jgi:hypothetical protein
VLLNEKARIVYRFLSMAKYTQKSSTKRVQMYIPLFGLSGVATTAACKNPYRCHSMFAVAWIHPNGQINSPFFLARVWQKKPGHTGRRSF